MRRALWLVSALAGLAGVAACDAGVGHIFGGYPYDEAGDCLGASAAVDVVEGPEPSSCKALRCWESPGGATYVTVSACDAPPDFVDHSGDTTGPCVKALAAYARPDHGRCLASGAGGADGGS